MYRCDTSLIDLISIASDYLYSIRNQFSSDGYWILQFALNDLYRYALEQDTNAENKGYYWYGPRPNDFCSYN